MTFRLLIDYEETPDEPRERCLYCAVLERAYRDVSDSCTIFWDKRDAVAWFFNRTEYPADSHVTFKSCIEVIPLGPSEIEFLLDAARATGLHLETAAYTRREKEKANPTKRRNGKTTFE